MNDDMMNLNNVTLNGLVYLASPYTKYSAGHDAAYREAARLTGLLLEYDNIVFSPIVYGHTMNNFVSVRSVDEQWDFWMSVCLPFLWRSDTLVVAMLDGWKESRGVMEEIRYASQPSSNMEIFFLNPKTLELTKDECNEI